MFVPRVQATYQRYIQSVYCCGLMIERSSGYCVAKKMPVAYKVSVPTLNIMAITGHRTEKAFLNYIKVTPHEHACKLREIWARQTLKVV